MGTSQARRAPAGKKWRLAKRTMGAYVTQSPGGSVTAAEVLSRYWAALAEGAPQDTGGRGATVVPEIFAAALRLVDFYIFLGRYGLTLTRKAYGLASGSQGFVVSPIPLLVERLGGTGARLEEAVARAALVEFFRREEVAALLLAPATDAVQSSGIDIAEKIYRYLALALHAKLLADLGETLEARAPQVATGQKCSRDLFKNIQGKWSQLSDDTEVLDVTATAEERTKWLGGHLARLTERWEDDTSL